MYQLRSLLTSLVIIASLCIVGKAQDQEYIITGPADTQFIPTNYRGNTQNEYVNSGRLSPFRQSPQGFHHQQPDSYLAQRDLQTSDLPYHLQQTLPQYRITTQTPPIYTLQQQQQQFNFPNSPPAPFRPLQPSPSSSSSILQHQQQNRQTIIHPSTHRPNYSHLFSHNHIRNPQQTETFLGEITLQSPAELPNQFNVGFKQSAFLPSSPTQQIKPTLSTNTQKPQAARLEDNPRGNFLNHRTRIFAPDPNENKSKNLAKPQNYFINNNGDVFINATPPTKLKQNQPKNSFNIESLLEEPLKTHTNTKSDNVVEVVKSLDDGSQNDDYSSHAIDYDYETTNPPSSAEYIDEEEEEGYQKDQKNEDEEHNIEDEDQLDEHIDDDNNIDQNSDENHKEVQTNKSFEVITTKPTTTMVKEDNFEKFVDSTVIDTTEKDSTTENFDENTEIPPEPVVSVVTTKSVINNTIIATGTPIPPVTERMIITTSNPNDNTTDTWVVVASVQTSRSVSGARYLPSSIVAQEERVKLLNENPSEKNKSDEEDYEEIVTTLSPTTTTKQKTSTESLIDKLDRVQSDLSSGLLSGGFKGENTNFTVITENGDKVDSTTMFDIGITSIETTTQSTTTTTKSSNPPVVIRKFSPNARPPLNKQKRIFDNFRSRKTSTTTTTTTIEPSVDLNLPQGDAPASDDKNVKIIPVQNISSFLPPGYKRQSDDNNSKLVEDIIKKFQSQQNTLNEKASSATSTTSSTTTTTTTTTTTPKPLSIIDSIIKDDISAFLPPDYKPLPEKATTEDAKPIDISDLLPPHYKSSNKTKIEITKVDDVSALLPPGYSGYKSYRNKASSTTAKPPQPKIENILANAKPVQDISSLLPPGFKMNSSSKVEKLFNQAKSEDINAFLPPGYKARTTEKPFTTPEKIPPSLLPPGYKLRDNDDKVTTTSTSTSTTPATTTKSAGGGFKVVFPSRPGGGARKSVTRLTTPKNLNVEEVKVTPPTIQKGWPSRATTEFTGWPTPSTTPISIEKLLEAARTASTSTTSSVDDLSSPSTTTTSTTTTTTTQKPTTPGICQSECDLAGTIKLVGGAAWVPELLDRNTKEWQILANEVQNELEQVYSKSDILSRWYKGIRIDGFSEGSILVDYLVELSDLGRQVDTLEIRRLFHESLDEAIVNSTLKNREGKALNDTNLKLEDKLSLGNFIVDPKYTDFIVLPKEVYPTVGYAEDNVLLPQWAIAVIVIGLASLLFVIIFGVTVLVNRQKNAKKKTPVPLTEDMLNELNKNHMGGFDNYGAEDLYNMEDVWNDRGYDPTKMSKKRSSGSIHDNSMSNLYDSWRSEWNGYYYNAYYGNNPGSSHGGYGRRRSDYDTNF